MVAAYTGGLTVQVVWLGLRVGNHLALSLHSSSEPGKGPITIAIRARFEHDTSTTRYNTLRGFSCARIRHRFDHSTRISGRRVLHVD